MSKTSSSENAKRDGSGMRLSLATSSKKNSIEKLDDDLQLRVPANNPDMMANFAISQDLVDHLNEEIRGLKNESARLYNLIREKDLEIKRLRKHNDEAEVVGVSGVTNEVVAVKIVEMSKRIRELTAEVESEKNKSKQFLKQLRDLEASRSIQQSNPSALPGKAAATPRDEERLENELKAANDRARLAENRIAELRNQLEESRREARVAVRVLTQEVGDGVDVHALLRSEGQGGWKGRAQQIQMLQKKIAELKASSSASDSVSVRQFGINGDVSDFDSVVMAGGDLSSTRQSTANNRQIETIKRFEKERRAEQERLTAEKAAIEKDYEDVKQKLNAAKARNKILAEELKSSKDRHEQLIEKSRHDDEFIKALLKQQEQLRQSLLAQPAPERVMSAKVVATAKSSETTQRSGSASDSRRIVELEGVISRLQKELEQCRSLSAANSRVDVVSSSEAEVIELKGLLQAANIECSKRGETVRMLHEQIDKLTEERLALSADLAANRKEHALLEKQIGKLKLDLEKATGRGGEASQRHRAEVSLTEIEDLRARLEVLTEERASYRLALERSSQQRKDELLLFENLLNETKRIFSQSVRQLARRQLNNTDVPIENM